MRRFPQPPSASYCAEPAPNQVQMASSMTVATPASPDVSVIVPARNEANQIADTVAALLRALRRTGHPGELLVVDDASTDATADLAQAAGAQVHRRESRCGPLAAWNAGLQVTTAPLVIFCDADVLPEEDALAHLIAPLSDPAVGAVASQPLALTNHRTGGSRLVRASTAFSADFLHALRLRLADHDFVPMGRLMAVRRSALPTNLPELWPCDRVVARLVRQGGFVVVYEPRARVGYWPPETWTGLRADYLRTRVLRPPPAIAFDPIAKRTLALTAGSVARHHPVRALAWIAVQVLLATTVRWDAPRGSGEGTLVWDSVHTHVAEPPPSRGLGLGNDTGPSVAVQGCRRNRPMVLVLSRFRPDLPGGVETVAREQVTQLRAGAWDAQPAWAYDRGVLIARVPILGDLVAALRFARLVAVRQPAVVLVNGAEYAWALLRRRARSQRQVVVVWHGVRSHQLEQYVRTGVLPALLAYPLGRANRLLEWSARTADHHVAITPAIAADITATFHLPPASVEVIPNGASQAARQLQPVAPRPWTYRLVWVGAEGGWRPGQKKGLDLALDACLRARVTGLPVSLTVVGLDRPPTWLGRSLAAQPWVRWVGGIPHTAVLHEIAAADALLAPSRSENMSLAMLESMVLERPVICHRDVGGWLVGEAGIAVQSWSADAFASALAHLYAPEWDRPRAARAARERTASFNWALSGERYRRLLAALSGYEQEDVEGRPALRGTQNIPGGDHAP